MNRKWLLFLCLISVILVFSFPKPGVQALGTAYFVSPTATSLNACTQSDPCDPATAIALANDGDILYFKYGTYTRTTDPILSITEGISLYGGWDGEPTGAVNIDPVAYPTIFDGEDERRAMSINYNTDAYPILITGLNFINCLVDPGYGGAINVVDGNVVIDGNRFADNYAKSYGGAIYIDSSFDVIVRNNYFVDNSVTYGGGAIATSLPTGATSMIYIEDNQFTGGMAEYGTAIHVSFSPTHITRNLFIDMPGEYAVSFASNAGPSSQISNNMFVRLPIAFRASGSTISKHQVWNNTFVECDVAIAGYQADIEVVNNIIADTTTSINVTGGNMSGSHNLFYNNSTADETLPLTHSLIDTAPQFIDADNDDYHLSKYSPAIDAGTVVDLLEDFDGDKRYSGSGFDIGADEVMSDYFIFLPMLLK